MVLLPQKLLKYFCYCENQHVLDTTYQSNHISPAQVPRRQMTRPPHYMHQGLATPDLSVDIVSRGSHTHSACITICNRDQDFWLAKFYLDRWLHSKMVLDRLIFQQKALQMFVLLNLTLLQAAWSPLWSIHWSLDLVQITMLIPWFHFDPGRKWFYSFMWMTTPWQYVW